MGSVIITFSISNKKISKPNQRVKSQMPLTQDSQTTFKPNLTCICLSPRARYVMPNPDETPCKCFGPTLGYQSSEFMILAFHDNPLEPKIMKCEDPL